MRQNKLKIAFLNFLLLTNHSVPIGTFLVTVPDFLCNLMPFIPQGCSDFQKLKNPVLKQKLIPRDFLIFKSLKILSLGKNFAISAYGFVVKIISTDTICDIFCSEVNEPKNSKKATPVI
jgi:hypothetical protein